MFNTRKSRTPDALLTPDTMSVYWSRQLALTTTALTVALLTSPALAIDYSFGEVSGSVDTFISAGASMRTSARDCRNLGFAHGGCKIYDASGLEKGAGVNSDDGNLNYGQWDVFSGALKATSEVGATWRNFNAFVRGTAFVDPIVDNTDFRDLDSAARSEVSQNAKLLDYFVGGSFDVGGLPLELRGGNQVISWGESTFIQNGINVINPIDISAVRKPGSEVKEFFTPILAVKAALGLPNNFSVEGFYQFKSDNIVPDPAGTYFSGADIVGRGSQPIRSGVSDFGDDNRFNPFEIRDGLSADTLWVSRLGVNVPSVSIERANDKNADDGGEFGFALRYFNEELNNGMEFGLFFINYHSRLPIVTTSMPNLNNAYSIASATNFSAASRAANALTQNDGVTPATALENLPFNVGVGTGPVSGTGPGRVPRNNIEAAQMLCNALAGLGAPLAAQGLGDARGPGFSLAEAGIAKVNFNTPGGTTNCNSIALLRTGAADLERNFAALAANSQQFRLEYPEDIKLVGASMSTTLGSLAFQAEVTYRHDQPLSYVGSEVSALSSDLSGNTAFVTGARMPVGTGPGQAPAGSIATTYNHAPTRFGLVNSRANNQSAAHSGAPGDNLYTFAEAVAIAQNAIEADGTDRIPGTLATAALTPTPGLIAAADKARAGTLTVADLPGAFFVGGVNTGASGVIAGTGGTVTGAGPGALLGLGGITQGALPNQVVFPAGTAAGLVATANQKGFIALDVEQLAAVPALAPGQTIASNVANGRAADVQVARHADSGVDGQPLIPITPQTRASVLTAANVRPDGFIETPREDVFTAQTTITSVLFGSNPVVQFASADGGAAVTEIGMVLVPGISTSSAIAARGSEGLLNPIAAATYKLNADLKGPTNWATPFSWGAQGIFNLTYNRVFGSPVNLVPQIAWRWDLGGRTPAPLGNYMAESKAIGLSLAANYQSRWTGSVSWVANFGPDAPLDDRDFASINIAYAF
ncbi:MAG: DUF1302 family protein [Pseudomonadota bacterium]